MKKFYAMLALFAIAFAGCKKDKPVKIDNPEPAKGIYVEASFATDGMLSGYDFEWSADDAITFCGAENAPVELKAAEVAADKRSAKFGPLDKEDAASVESYAAYPAGVATLACNGASSELSFTLAKVQNGDLKPIFYALDKDKTAPLDMKFKPVTSAIELTLGFDATKVTISAYDNESLAGNYKYAIDGEDCDMVREGGESTVVLENLSAGVHYANVAAVKLARGLRVVYETAQGAMVETYHSGGIDIAASPAKISCETFNPIALTFAAESPEAETVAVSGSFTGISSILLNRIVLVGLGDTETTLDISGKTFSKTFTEVAEGTYTLFARLYYDNTYVDSQAVTVNVEPRILKNSEKYAEYEITVTAEGEVADGCVKSWNDTGAVTFALSFGDIPLEVIRHCGLQWSTHKEYNARSSDMTDPAVPQIEADGKCRFTVPTSEIIRLGTDCRYYFRGYIIFEDEQTSTDDDVYKYSPGANNIGNEGGGSSDFFQYWSKWYNY